MFHVQNVFETYKSGQQIQNLGHHFVIIYGTIALVFGFEGK
jgi:hypothetical protein